MELKHVVPFTRVIEHNHYEKFGDEIYYTSKTVISEEYPQEYKPDMDPHYLLNDVRNSHLAMKYKALAAEEADVIFGGRLAEYRFCDMAPVIEVALKVAIE